MKLLTFRTSDGRVAIGALNASMDRVLDLKQSAARAKENATEFDTMLGLIEGGGRSLDTARKLVANASWDSPETQRLADVKILAPVPVPQQIRDFSVVEQHVRQAMDGLAKIRAKRMGVAPRPGASAKVPDVAYKQPVYYKGNRFNVIGPDEDVLWPHYSTMLDYELEFGVFIGAKGKNISEADAHGHIFGYTIFNDFSARDAQEIEMAGGLGPAKGKDFDTGNAMGPWIVTRDEIKDAYNLDTVARVNGEEWSRNKSSCMLHTFERMIAHVSQDETLYPGEFFGSGTMGNGCGVEMDRWLKPGDVVELEVEGIGVLRNRVIGSPA